MAKDDSIGNRRAERTLAPFRGLIFIYIFALFVGEMRGDLRSAGWKGAAAALRSSHEGHVGLSDKKLVGPCEVKQPFPPESNTWNGFVGMGQFTEGGKS